MSAQTASDPITTAAVDREVITYGAVHLDVVDAGRSLPFWRAEHDLRDGVLSTRDPAGNARRLAALRAWERR